MEPCGKNLQKVSSQLGPIIINHKQKLAFLFDTPERVHFEIQNPAPETIFL